MDHSSPANRHPGESMPSGAWPGPSGLKGVGGWLLILCLMLTVVGPVVVSWLAAHEYRHFAPYFESASGLQAAIVASIAIKACAVSYGIYAGVGLWTVRPGAVATAKSALLWGLAADVVAAMLRITLGPASGSHAGLLLQVMGAVILDVAFFTLCFAYLNRSARVQATYGA